MLETIKPIIGSVVGIFATILLIIFVAKVMYKKAPPNVAMVITGLRGARTIIGQGALVIPILQRVDYMSLENIQSDFTSRDEIPTKDAINIMVDAVANVAISKEPALLKIAASKFLGYKPAQIREIITPVLEGNIREIISQTTLKELIQGDKKVFAERVIDNVAPNLRDMGLELTTFNIQNFKDRNGVIDNLGLENTVQISKDAAISKAQAEKEIAIAQAQASMAANEAQVQAEQDIARRQHELAIQKAELQRIEDTKQAEADAAYLIQEQEQRATVEARTAEANLVRMEKEIELKEREVAITERALEAEVKKKAEAEKYAAEQKADAELYQVQKASEAELFERQKQAEAELFEAERRAQAEKARSEATRVAMENEAAGIAAKGRAEAEAIQARAEAEAAGIQKKADAMKEYGDAAKQQMVLDVALAYVNKMPEIAAAVAKPMESIDNMTIYEGGTSTLTGSVTTGMKQVQDGFKDATGLDLIALLSGMMGGAMTK